MNHTPTEVAAPAAASHAQTAPTEMAFQELLQDVAHEAADLARKEGQLLKLQTEGKLRTVQRWLVTLVVAITVAALGGAGLVASAILGLGHVMPPWAAA